jgi:hypothetical protein
MTAATPEQLRSLADEPLMYNEAGVKFRGRAGKPIDELRAALRAAADQLEASVSHVQVRRVVKEWWLENEANADALIARILTADTAPQERAS